MSTTQIPKPPTTIINEAMFKLIIIGNSGSGKTCLINRYTKNEYNDIYRVTIGVEFSSKSIVIDENYRVKLQIWDTAGQESFQAIVKSFYRSAAAVVLVYSIVNLVSFQALADWIVEARENSPENAIFVLMGTHLDLQSQRQVTKQHAQAFMQKQQIALFFQTSSKTAQNITKAFDEIGKQLFMNQLKRRATSNMQMQIQMQNGNVQSGRVELRSGDVGKDRDKDRACC